MSNFSLAYDAIEEYVADRHSADSGRWQGLVPENDWGITAPAWEAAATGIVNIFNGKLPNGKSITVPRSAKRALHAKQLIDFQRYLAAKADALLGTQIIKVLER